MKTETDKKRKEVEKYNKKLAKECNFSSPKKMLEVVGLETCIAIGLDFTYWDKSTWSITWHNMDLRGAKGITWDDIVSSRCLDDIKGIILPDGMDFKDANLPEPVMYDIDFSKAKNLTPEQLYNTCCLSEGGMRSYFKLPDGMDFKDFTHFEAREIDHTDFSRTKNLTAEVFLTADKIDYCTLPANMDFRNVSLKDREIHGIDFSRVTGLTAENWLSAKKIDGCKLPADMDFSNVSLKGRDVSKVDFSKVAGLTLENLHTASNYTDCIFHTPQQQQAAEVNKISKEIAATLTGDKKDINTASLKAAWAIQKGTITKDDLAGLTKPEEIINAVDNAKAHKKEKVKEAVR